MRYKIELSDYAKTDLDQIYSYILEVPKSAEKILSKISSRIDSLETSPEKYMIYPDEPLKSQEIRYFIESKYYIFYKIYNDTETVVVRRIIHTGRYLGNQSI